MLRVASAALCEEHVSVHLQNTAELKNGTGAVVPAGEPRESRWVWAALCLLLVIYIFSALQVGPIGFFGRLEDDTLYFSSAKALANGQGYVLPSFPGHLRAKKYPELYPLLLAGVWRLDPHFPANVKVAVAITLAFGCISLVAAFLILRQMSDLGEWSSLLAIALFAFTIQFKYLSAGVLSDVPFAALLLGAVYLAERGLAKDRTQALMVIGAGVATGLSIGLRSLGIGMAAGIGLSFLARKRYREFLGFSAIAGPIALLWLWPSLGALLGFNNAVRVVNPTQSGWTQTLCYYSSYACNWRMNISNFRTLLSVIRTNFLLTLLTPGTALIHPLTSKDRLWGLVLVCILSFGAWAGMLRYKKRCLAGSFTLTFLCTLCLVVPWPYPPDRFLLPFLPLFFGALILEGRNFFRLISAFLRSRRSWLERTLAGALGAGGLALAALIAVNYLWSIPSDTARLASQLNGLLASRRGAYEWLRQNTAPDARVISYEDGLAYLYTGRQSLRPINCLTTVYYLGSRVYAERDASRIADVARHIGASYWIVSPDDFGMESPVDSAVLRARQGKLLASAPVVYRSPHGSVVVYDIRCVEGGRGPILSGTAGCAATDVPTKFTAGSP
jgi:hypothetical protein